MQAERSGKTADPTANHRHLMLHFAGLPQRRDGHADP
jgi:hypothetical protein